MALPLKMSRRAFLIGSAGILVASSVAFLLRNRLQSTPKAIVGDLNDIDDRMEFDVCIIGSGPAGAILGLSLLERGFRTVILESGLDMSSQQFNPNIQELDAYGTSGPIEYPVAVTRLRELGGTSNMWTGRCDRLHPLDFEKNAYTPPDSPWPITYSELEPYYELAEKTLRVRGGQLSNYHPPRKNNLPLPPNLDISKLKSLIGNVGVTIDDSPTSAGGSGKGPIRVAKDLLPSFSISSHGKIACGVTVTRLIPDPIGRITGAEVRSLQGGMKIVRARFYVVACGAIESTRLLLLSRSRNFLHGIGNGNDRVGRCFMEHPNINFSGKIDHRWNTFTPDYELGRSHQFYEEFKRQGLGSVLLVFNRSWVYRDELANWDMVSIKKKIGAIWGRIQKAELRIGATVEMYPSESNRLTLSQNIKDYFGNPGVDLFLSYTPNDVKTLNQVRSLIQKIYKDLGAEDVQETEMSWSHHHMGTCRMGDDPKTSVVDRNLRVHESPNLYVISSSVFVTGGASHPTVAIAAFSHRLADHLSVKLKNGDLGS